MLCPKKAALSEANGWWSEIGSVIRTAFSWRRPYQMRQLKGAVFEVVRPRMNATVRVLYDHERPLVQTWAQAAIQSSPVSALVCLSFFSPEAQSTSTIRSHASPRTSKLPVRSWNIVWWA